MTAYLTSYDLATRWNIHVGTVNRYRRTGLLKPIGQRGLGQSQYLYRLDEVERFEKLHNLVIHLQVSV